MRWTQHLPELPEDDYPSLTARLREIERRAYDLGVAFLDGEPDGKNATAILMAALPELAEPQARKAASRGVLHASR